MHASVSSAAPIRVVRKVLCTNIYICMYTDVLVRQFVREKIYIYVCV